MYLQVLIWLCVLTGTAYAAPVIGIVSAFASTAIGSIVVNAAIGIALSVGASLLQNMLMKKTQSRDPGTTVQLRVGGANPLFFPLGKTATAGVRVYYNVFQFNSVSTPNEYMVDVIAVSALPLPGQQMLGLWMNDRKVTVRTDLPKTQQGWPIQEYFKNGQYYAWVDFHDGTQTTVNPFLSYWFSGHPNYPWTSDMIGRGVAYITLTCRYDKDGLWQSGYPTVMVELPSVPLYDPRKDSSVGGSGPHRWDDPTTWEPSNNAMVRAYNVARGAFYYNGEWVYGGQNWPAMRLPVSNWMAAMNACDMMVGSEPQFHGGGMVECDIEVATTIEELLRSANALIAEVGGTYKVRVGAPGAPVMSFTDANIVVTREQGFDPFPGLEDTFNIARVTYTEPVEQWGTKEAPERRDATAITQDDNRELAFSIDLPWVLSNLTAQRIAKTALQNGRRFRRHSMYHAPLFWLIEPLDVVAWSSAHNGYVNKAFEVEQVTGDSALIQGLVIRENDPSDYSWNPISDPLPYEIIPVVPEIVPVQLVSGWQVFPAVIKDEQGRDRRPAIEVRFDGTLTDIDRVRVQVRTEGTTDPFYDASVNYPKEPVSTAKVILNGDFPPNTQMQVRGRFEPYSDRPTDWSSWLNVTTPDVRLIPGVDFDPYAGVVGFDQLGDDLKEYQDWVGSGHREIARRIEELDMRLADQELGNAYERTQLRQQLTVTYETAKANWEYDVTVVANAVEAAVERVERLDAEVFDPDTGIPSLSSALSSLTAYAGPGGTLAESVTELDSRVFDPDTGLPATAAALSALQTYAGPNGTLADAITALSASSTPGNVVEANFRMSVVGGPSGYARIGAEGRAGGTGAWRTAGWYIDVPTNPALPTRFSVLADQFVVLAGGNANNPFVVDGTAVRMNVANIGTVTAGTIRSPDNKFRINLTNGSIEWDD